MIATPMLRREVPALVALLCAFPVLEIPAMAQGCTRDVSNNWCGSVGVKAIVGPTFSGATETEFIWRPVVEVTWGDRMFLSTQKGAGIWLFRAGLPGDLRAGVSLGPTFEDLDTEEDTRLSGLDPVDEGLDLRLLAEWAWGDAELELVAAEEVSGDGHGGRSLEFTGGYEFSIRPWLSATVNPYLVWVDDQYADALYGVSEEYARNGSLAAYSPRGGLERVGAALGLSIRTSDRVSIVLEWERSELMNHFARSPIVLTDAQSETTITAIVRY